MIRLSSPSQGGLPQVPGRDHRQNLGDELLDGCLSFEGRVRTELTLFLPAQCLQALGAGRA